MRTSHPTAYGWLWMATTSGALGEGISLSVLPLIMASLTRDPILVALLQVAAALPWLLFGLQAGALSDRWDRARVLFVADLVRAALVAVLALLVFLRTASVTALLIFAFASSMATIMFRAADAALLPSLVPSDELARANGRLKAGETVTGSFVGPASGSVLFAIANWFPLLVQSAAFAASVGCLRRLPHRSEPRPPSGMTLRSEVTQGLRHVWRDRTLRTLAGATTLQGAGTWMLMAVLVLYCLQTLDAPAASYGVLITAYAVGSLIGAGLASKATAHLSSRTCLTLAALLGGVSILVMATTQAFALAATCMATLGIATMVLGVIAVTVRQLRTPEELLGRVSSAFNVLNVGSAPVGAPIAGLIGTHYGIPVAVAAAGATFCAAAVLLAIGLQRPKNQDPDTPSGSNHPTPWLSDRSR